MAKYLSQEWHTAAQELAQAFPERPGASARVGYKVTGGPAGDVDYHQIIEDGRLVEQALGTLGDADVTLTSTWDDSVKVAKGELDANVAFMQGRFKVAGNIAKLMALMPVTTSAEYQGMAGRILAVTEF